MIPPVVSIIVPAHNEEKFIGRCIRSLLSMKFPRKDFEIIVINDNSSDHTSRVLKTFDEELIIINNSKQLGLPASLNKGIRHAKGRYIIRVDADDYVHSEYINILSMHLGYNESIDSVCCDYQLVDKDEKIISIKKWFEEPIGCGIMFRIEDIIDLGLYDEKMKFHEDKDLLIRFLKDHNIYSVPIPLYRYRRHDSNITNQKEEMSSYLKILKKKFADNLLAKEILT